MLRPNKIYFTDIFDTLLLRRPISERRRQYSVAEKFVDNGFMPDKSDAQVKAVYWARRKAQFSAFRTMNITGYIGEVRLSDIITKQVILLGLNDDAKAELLAIELEVEKECLYPNLKLIKYLKDFSENGGDVYALSDTTLDVESLTTLLNHFFDTAWIKRIYSSADEQKTKRNGALFNHVVSTFSLSRGDIRHIGDNRVSDGARAVAAGLNVKLVPRSIWHLLRTKLNGLWFETLQAGKARQPKIAIDSQEDFGRHVLGPILASFSLQLWIYLSSAKDHNEPVALFCARGGLIMREVYESVLKQMNLTGGPESKDFMISRFILAKAGLVQGDQSVLREIQREYGDMPLNEVISSFSGLNLEVSEQWHQPYSIAAMNDYLGATEAKPFLKSLQAQHDLLLDHLNDLTKNADRAILVDTGLYGSIQLFIQNIFPQIATESVLLARCNYKNFDTEHFSQVTGILSERHEYDPFDPHSSVLRYWQLIEEIFEPDIDSVRHFHSVKNKPVSNLEKQGWQDRISNHANPIYMGVMAYITELTPTSLGKLVVQEKSAWKTFKRIILFPTKDDVRMLTVGPRSRDFGLPGYADDALEASKTPAQRLKVALWKTAAVHDDFPFSALLMQLLMEMGYILRRLLKLSAAFLKKARKALKR